MHDRLVSVFLEYLYTFKSALVQLLGGGIAVLLSFVANLLEWKSIPNWLFWATAVVAFFWASYEVWKRDHIALRDLRDRKLEILFEPTRESYYQQHPGVPMFRICVSNAGGSTIDNVGVDVVAMEPCGFQFLPVPLQATHNVTSPLDPGGMRFFDVVQRFPNGTAELLHSVSGAPRKLQPRAYKLTLQAHGRDAGAVNRIFTLDVEADRFFLTPEDTLNGPSFSQV